MKIIPSDLGQMSDNPRQVSALAVTKSEASSVGMSPPREMIIDYVYL